jgi:hypothetical protein
MKKLLFSLFTMINLVNTSSAQLPGQNGKLVVSENKQYLQHDFIQ